MTNAIDSKSVSESHVIRVPEELVGGWISEIWHEGTPVRVAASDRYIADKAAQWGHDQREPELQERADQEVDACCEWLADQGYGPTSERLRDARRPKQLLLAEQALNAAYVELVPEGKHGSLIISALKRLKELETQNG